MRRVGQYVLPSWSGSTGSEKEKPWEGQVVLTTLEDRELHGAQREGAGLQPGKDKPPTTPRSLIFAFLVASVSVCWEQHNQVSKPGA